MVDVRAKALIVVILAVFLVLPVIVERELAARFPSGASPYNFGPDGTSGLVEALTELGFNVTIVKSWSDSLRTSNPCLIIVVSPELPYSDTELRVVRELALSGSNLLIADEGTFSNSIMEYLGIPARISGRIVHANGSPTFSVPTRTDGGLLSLVFAYASSIDLEEVVSKVTEVIAEVDDSILAVMYSASNYRAIILGDGTVLTNSLMNPKNLLNPNYMFTHDVARNLCTRGTVLVDGSKYELRPLPLTSKAPPLIAYLNLLSRVLGLSLLALVTAYLTLSRPSYSVEKKKTAFSAPLGAYELARTLCQGTDLSETLAKYCDFYTKTRKAQPFLDNVAEALKKDRNLVPKILKEVLEKNARQG